MRKELSFPSPHATALMEISRMPLICFPTMHLASHAVRASIVVQTVVMAKRFYGPWLPRQTRAFLILDIKRRVWLWSSLLTYSSPLLNNTMLWEYSLENPLAQWKKIIWSIWATEFKDNGADIIRQNFQESTLLLRRCRFSMDLIGHLEALFLRQDKSD